MYRPPINWFYLLGVFNIFLAIIHIGWTVFVAIDGNNANLNLNGTLHITQALISSGILLFVGIMLLRHGWRMGSRIRLAFLLMNLLTIYYTIKDLQRS